MMDGLLAWLQSTGGPLPYVVLGLASLLEYVFPPFPGDTVTLFGVFLAATAGWSPAGVYVVLNVGAVAGGMLAYAFGRWLAERGERKPPRFFRSERARGALASAVERFERHGAAYLALNRFLPAMRAFFFIAAGMARLPAWKVALYGALSAMLWNGLIFAVGWTVGDNFDRLLELSRTYSKAAFALLGLVGLALLVRWWWRRRRPRAPESRPDAAEPPPRSGTVE